MPKLADPSDDEDDEDGDEDGGSDTTKMASGIGKGQGVLPGTSPAPVPKSGQDKLTAEDWKSIVRAVYPLVAADAKEGLTAYNTGPKCKKWLEELEGGWEKMMDSVVKKLNEKIGVASTERLF